MAGLPVPRTAAEPAESSMKRPADSVQSHCWIYTSPCFCDHLYDVPASFFAVMYTRVQFTCKAVFALIELSGNKRRWEWEMFLAAAVVLDKHLLGPATESPWAVYGHPARRELLLTIPIHAPISAEPRAVMAFEIVRADERYRQAGIPTSKTSWGITSDGVSEKISRWEGRCNTYCRISMLPPATIRHLKLSTASRGKSSIR
jgi:hypothetical protein